MSRNSFRMSCFFTFTLSVMLRYFVLPAPNYGAIHDDELMVRLASNIIQGNWLGEYSDLGHLTLSKPAGYPLFLAWTHFLPWAPTMTVHLLLLCGILLVAHEFRALNVCRPIVLFFIIISAFYPQWFGASMSRIYRDGFLTALSFLGLGLSIYLGRLWVNGKMRGVNNYKQMVHLLAIAFFSGLTISWIIATKPGWYPISIVMLLFATRNLAVWRDWGWRTWLPRFVSVGLIGLIGVFSIPSYIKFQNHSHYDISQLDSFAYGSFPDVLSKWSSVQSDDKRKYLLVDASQRERVYSVSPTASRLKPYLDTAEGQDWRNIACESPLKICDDSSAWFTWDLRDAMHEAGLDENAMMFETYLSQISKDIARACSTKELQCNGGGLAPGVLSLRDISKREIVDAYATAFDWMIYPDIGPSMRGGIPAVGSDTTKMWDLTIRGLPPRSALNIYRPEASALGNTVALVQKIYNSLMPITLLLAFFGTVLQVKSSSERNKLRFISLSSMLGVVLFVGQLALLESSSGLYVSSGKTIYLLPVFPFILVFIGVSFSQLELALTRKVNTSM